MQEFDAGIGEVRHRLTVPPISYPDYLRLQRVLLAPSNRVTFWQGMLVAIISGGVVGAVFAILGAFELNLFFIHFESGWTLYLANLEVVAVFVLAFLVGFAVLWIASLRQLSRLRRSFHERLVGEGEPWILALGTKGLGTENAGATSGTPWRRIDHMVASGTMRFLVINSSSALWIPEAALTAEPAVERFLQERIAGSRAPAAIAPRQTAR